MKLVEFNHIERYIGIDIVEEVICRNNIDYANDNMNFYCMDLVKDNLPYGDLLLCRDCLVHLDFNDGINIIKNIKRAGIKYLLVTTFTNRIFNRDLYLNDIWRPLNMELYPFNFPKPLYVINEKCTEGNNEFADKSLGLYQVSDISI